MEYFFHFDVNLSVLTSAFYYCYAKILNRYFNGNGTGTGRDLAVVNKTL